jgi:hypothetical protein
VWKKVWGVEEGEMKRKKRQWLRKDLNKEVWMMGGNSEWVAGRLEEL